MPKLTSLLLLVAMFLTSSVYGQTLPDAPLSKANSSDLRQVFSQETEKIKKESDLIDADKMNKTPRQATRNNWSNTKTALVVVLAVVVVGALYVIVKNTRRCVDRDPPNCSFVDDPNCVCTEYAR